MLGARVDDDDGRFVSVGATVLEALLVNAGDAQQRVVCRAFEGLGVDQGFIVEVQQRGLAGALVIDHVVGALAQRVEEQAPALRGVAQVVHAGIGREIHGDEGARRTQQQPCLLWHPCAP